MEVESGVGGVVQTDSRLIQAMISGLEELPELGSKIVRIFTSSTFTGIVIVSYRIRIVVAS